MLSKTRPVNSYIYSPSKHIVEKEAKTLSDAHTKIRTGITCKSGVEWKGCIRFCIPYFPTIQLGDKR